jgi:hypothetical protein
MRFHAGERVAFEGDSRIRFGAGCSTGERLWSVACEGDSRSRFRVVCSTGERVWSVAFEGDSSMDSDVHALVIGIVVSPEDDRDDEILQVGDRDCCVALLDDPATGSGDGGNVLHLDICVIDNDGDDGDINSLAELVRAGDNGGVVEGGNFHECTEETGECAPVIGSTSRSRLAGSDSDGMSRSGAV